MDKSNNDPVVALHQLAQQYQGAVHETLVEAADEIERLRGALTWIATASAIEVENMFCHKAAWGTKPLEAILDAIDAARGK